MMSRSSSGIVDGVVGGGGRGGAELRTTASLGYETRAGGDQYHGRVHQRSGDSLSPFENNSAQRRNHFQQHRGQDRHDRYLTDAAAASSYDAGGGVIRSASLQHHPSSSASPFTTAMTTTALATTSSASAIGTNLSPQNQHHSQLNRSSSSGGRPSPSKAVANATAAPTSPGNVRHLKKTVRFDNDEDDPTPAPQPSSGVANVQKSSASRANAGPSLAANGLVQSSETKTWDWLMKGHGNRQESRESAARDSGVETLTSGEDVVVPHSSTATHHKHPYDHRSNHKVNNIIHRKERDETRQQKT